jgi:hypothetical protein
MQDKPPKERWQYFLDYYKWPALVTLLVLVFAVQTVVMVVTQKEAVISSIMLNCKLNIEDEAFLQDFYDYAGVDPRTQEAAFYSDLTLVQNNKQHNNEMFQRIIAGVAVADTDFIAGKNEAFNLCAYHSSQMFLDLRKFLDEETLNKFSDKIYYVEQEILDYLNAPPGTQIDVDLSKYPDPHKPELMKKPIPIGINVSTSKAFRDAYYREDAVIYIGVIANAPHPEMTRQFIEFLLAQMS